MLDAVHVKAVPSLQQILCFARWQKCTNVFWQDQAWTRFVFEKEVQVLSSCNIREIVLQDFDQVLTGAEVASVGLKLVSATDNSSDFCNII